LTSCLCVTGEELGMLEDMEVGVADLSSVAFTVTEAESERPDDLLPTLRGTWGSFVVDVPLPSETFSSLPQELKSGRLIRVEPVLFNIGINQHQSLAERYKHTNSTPTSSSPNPREALCCFCSAVPSPHSSRSVSEGNCRPLQQQPALKRWRIYTDTSSRCTRTHLSPHVCRKVNGVRLTSCKSAKDRTAMSVTLEQCLVCPGGRCWAVMPTQGSLFLGLIRQSVPLVSTAPGFNCAWDGCRTENVQKNVGSRKFAFSSVQLLTFPKLYRPPDGSYG
ncbi:hypothetical protein GOODEAATRI_020862, partial [Goodea atripinnis]